MNTYITCEKIDGTIDLCFFAKELSIEELEKLISVLHHLGGKQENSKDTYYNPFHYDYVMPDICNCNLIAQVMESFGFVSGIPISNEEYQEKALEALKNKLQGKPLPEFVTCVLVSSYGITVVFSNNTQVHCNEKMGIVSRTSLSDKF